MASMRIARRAVLAAVISGAAAIGGVAAGGRPAAAAGPARHYLSGSTPKWLSKAHTVGATSSSEQVSFGMVLGLRDEAGAEAALQAISSPDSASYGQWLSNQTF